METTAGTQFEIHSVHGWVEAIAARQPNASAVIMSSDALTYAELNARANQLALWLQSQGVCVGSRVGICLHRSFEMAVAVLAVLKANAAYVPLDPEYPNERLAVMRDDAALSLLLTTSNLLPRISSPKLTSLCLDSQLEVFQSFPDKNLNDQGNGVTPTYLIYTSGSTGKPKGVEMPRRALLNLIRWVAATTEVPANSRTLQFPSLSFDVSFEDIFSTWCMGGTLVLIPEEVRRDPTQLWETIVTQKIHRMYLPAVALQQLAEAFRPEMHGANCLRWIVTSGEQLVITPAVRELFRRLMGCVLQNEYGPSETHVVTALRLDPDPETWTARPAIGTPIPTVDTVILDESGEPVAEGEIGELFLGGVCLAHGYFRREELTSEKFVTREIKGKTARLYRTGDLVRTLSDGNLEFLGRADQQVKIRGYRVELGEIETVLLSHNAIREAVLRPWEVSDLDKRLAAYIVPHPEKWLDLSALKVWIAEKLPDYMVPATFVVMDSLPLTVNGKVDTARLPVPQLSTSERADDVPPRSEMERTLAGIWQSLLKVEQIGVQDHFFDLGGHSLHVAQVQEQVRQATGKAMAATDLFQFPTLGALAAHLEATGTDAAPMQRIADQAARRREAMLRQKQAAMKR
jgi:amino acid adenylation domain-containing protein